MNFIQLFTALFAFFVYSSALVITPRDAAPTTKEVSVKTVSLPSIDAGNDSLVQGLESIIPDIVATIFKALGTSSDQFSTVIPQVLGNLNLTSVSAQPLIAAAETAAANGSSGAPPASNSPALTFIAQIVNEVFKVLGVSASTIISNLPGIISTLIKLFTLTVPDIVKLFVGLFTGNPLSLVNIIGIANDVFQDIQLGISEAINIIQQILQQLT